MDIRDTNLFGLIVFPGKAEQLTTWPNRRQMYARKSGPQRVSGQFEKLKNVELNPHSYQSRYKPQAQDNRHFSKLSTPLHKLGNPTKLKPSIVTQK